MKKTIAVKDREIDANVNNDINNNKNNNENNDDTSSIWNKQQEQINAILSTGSVCGNVVIEDFVTWEE